MEPSHLNTEGKRNPEMFCGNVLNFREIISYNWIFRVLNENYNKQETCGKLIELSAEREEGI